MASTLYSREILRLAISIPHHRRLEHPQASVHKRSPVCGSRIVVDVVLDGDGRIVALGQEVKSCVLGQASAALMGQHALGRRGADLAEAREALAAYLAGTREDPGEWPGLDVFAEAKRFSGRHASILLAFEAAAEAAAQAQSATACG